MEAADPVAKEASVSKRSPWLRKQVGLYEVLSLAAVLALTGSSSARAEGGRSSLGARLRSTLSFDVSGGGATSLFGGVTDAGRGSLELALHARLPLLVRSGLQLDYTAGVVPVALAFGTRVSGAGLPDGTLRTETVFGAGVDGLGLVAHLGGSDRWQPYVSVVGGVRLFERPVPDPRGIRFNFSADLGAGVAFRVAPAHRVAVGVVLHHLSNGGLGSANPSFNGFDITVSVGRWFERGSRRGPS
jgi:Lipid A 3-O-deacylase (PagL)